MRNVEDTTLEGRSLDSTVIRQRLSHLGEDAFSEADRRKTLQMRTRKGMK